MDRTIGAVICLRPALWGLHPGLKPFRFTGRTQDRQARQMRYGPPLLQRPWSRSEFQRAEAKPYSMSIAAAASGTAPARCSGRLRLKLLQVSGRRGLDQAKSGLGEHERPNDHDRRGSIRYDFGRRVRLSFSARSGANSSLGGARSYRHCFSSTVHCVPGRRPGLRNALTTLDSTRDAELSKPLAGRA